MIRPVIFQERILPEIDFHFPFLENLRVPRVQMGAEIWAHLGLDPVSVSSLDLDLNYNVHVVVANMTSSYQILSIPMFVSTVVNECYCSQTEQCLFFLVRGD